MCSVESDKEIEIVELIIDILEQIGGKAPLTYISLKLQSKIRKFPHLREELTSLAYREEYVMAIKQKYFSNDFS